MPYHVRLSERAGHDLQAIYDFIRADYSEPAFDWFKELTSTIYSLEELAERGAIVPESKELRHLLFGRRPDTYMIIYAVEKTKQSVTVLHIRHAARSRLPVK